MMNDTKYLLEECNDLYATFISNLRVQDDHRMRMCLLEAIYTTLLIRLHDILKSLKGKRTSIAFNADFEIEPQNDVKDIFDLISVHRNAACHTKSGWKNFKDTKVIFSFNIVHGKNPRAFKIHSEYYAGNDYQDDVAIYYGHWRIYCKRHIARLLQKILEFI